MENPAGYGPVEPAPQTQPLPRRTGGKVLILDDDRAFLEIYSRILSRLPSGPDVHVADCATRALALLEAEPYEMLITDLRMPRIDGFQVLMSARKRFPELKTVAMTGMGNQQYRARAYASGIDLYTEKPRTPAEIQLFGECVEALLAKGAREGGFRGIQSKSLMDLVQIECLSQNSSVLRITRGGSLEGRIWVSNGAVIDAEVQGLRGEAAFKHIFGWKTGHFELLPGEPGRERTIFASYESLLLDSAQTLDEAAEGKGWEPVAVAQGLSRELQPLAMVHGIEGLLLRDGDAAPETWGVENPEEFGLWLAELLKDFGELGDYLNAGPMRAIEGTGPVRGMVLLSDGTRRLLACLDRRLTVREIREAGRELATLLTKG